MPTNLAFHAIRCVKPSVCWLPKGLVDVAARRGASVAVMSDQEARETIEVRALLEGQNARLAARRHDKELINRIEAVLKKGTAAVAAGRFDQLFQLNQQFHDALAAAGQNRVLGELLQKLRDRTAMLFAPMSPSRQSRSWNEHAEILRAIIAGDERLAAALAAEHVMRAGADFLAGLDVVGELPQSSSRRATRLNKGVAAGKSSAGSRAAPPAFRDLVRSAVWFGQIERQERTMASSTQCRSKRSPRRVR